MLHVKKKCFAMAMAFVCAVPHFARAQCPSSWGESTVFVLPDAGRTPWLEAIQGAEHTIEMSAYKLSDPQMIEALKAAVGRGVAVHLLVEEEAYTHEGSANETSPMARLKSVAKLYTLSKRFSQSHHKMILVDKEWGLISTGNLDAESFDGVAQKGIAPARDFAVPILDEGLVREMGEVFRADIQDERLCLEETRLVWGPDKGRSAFLALINGAQKSIDVYQQSVQDEGLTNALVGAARAGVKVRVLMMPFPFGPKSDPNIPNQKLMREAGIEVGLATHLYIHAKLMIVDGQKMYVGSSNFYTPTLDGARELGVIVQNTDQLKRVQDVFQGDWSRCQFSSK